MVRAHPQAVMQWRHNGVPVAPSEEEEEEEEEADGARGGGGG